MRASQDAVTIERKNYRPPHFAIAQVSLKIDLDPHHTKITSILNLQQITPSTTLVLQGEELKLLELKLDGEPIQNFQVDKASLAIPNLPPHCELTIVTECDPANNSSLMGLYMSRGSFFTQCEAEGFRKLTYFLDRPDVMTRYTVTLRADKTDYPILLANGNLVAQGDLENGRHYAVWEDPFPKPSYLFALVAGKFSCIEEHIKTASGANKLLQVWVAPEDLNKTRYAMDSLIAAIRWDEERFGLELDLERFMIVAVSDFNMGAMENKGLNIFNTKFVLADANSATDTDYAGIESVVAHEYFHNWTGNRVTCRDWFQLSLKEGLTVFRDQEFSADMMGSASGRAVKRIEDVRLLRQAQFAEDAGPMAHPVRPDSYQEINNFYTLTVYEKGAEVVRMLQTLVGPAGFREGMDHYFERYDGEAVTCDDFLSAIADANQRDFSQFSLWYSQAGTPHVHARGEWDKTTQTYQLHLSQTCPATPGQPVKQAFHIPITIALLNAQGQMFELNLADSASSPTQAKPTTELVLELTQTEQSFTFQKIDQAPIPSLLRNFSAPVILEYDYSETELLHLLQHDTDPFNRWEASQRLASTHILKLAEDLDNQHPLSLDARFISVIASIIQQNDLDPAFRELILTLPSEAWLAQQVSEINPQAIHQAREFARLALARALEKELAQIYHTEQTPGEYQADARSAGKRALKNRALSLLVENKDSDWQAQAVKQYQQSNNMTDRFAALAALVHSHAEQAPQVLADFYERYQQDALVLDKWFSLQATCSAESERPMVDLIRDLMQHPDFTLKNPNRARSLIHAFCLSNPAGFHTADGAGYAFWAEQVIALDAINPQIAARLARALDRWRAYAMPWKTLMQEALQQIETHYAELSSDTREIISKALATNND